MTALDGSGNERLLFDPRETRLDFAKPPQRSHASARGKGSEVRKWRHHTMSGNFAETLVRGILFPKRSFLGYSVREHERRRSAGCGCIDVVQDAATNRVRANVSGKAC